MNKLFLGTAEDTKYLHNLKPYFGGHTTYHVTQKVDTLTQVLMYCVKRNINGVVSTNTEILLRLLALQGNEKKRASLDDYAGSLFVHKGIEFVFINPLKHLFTVPYGRFLIARHISKITKPGDWREPTRFSWEIAEPSTISGLYVSFRNAFLLAVDIETFKTPLSMRCVGYTALFLSSSGDLTSHSIVIPANDSYNLSWIRKFNSLPAAKITQRGKYDNSYLLRFNAPLYNWVWDTANLFHAWYSEMPKDLAFINAFALRSVQYWKDLAETSDLQQYYKYNCLDTWATANSMISLIEDMPVWALRNYVLEFPVNFPALLAEMTGIKRNEQRLLEKNKEVETKITDSQKSLSVMVGSPSFNSNSPPQVKKLLTILGCKDLAEVSSDENHLKKAILRHPLNQRLLTKVLDIRGWRKLNSTYLTITDNDHEAKEFHGRILFALNPDGTDTTRLASKEHHFWCGMNIQNIPIREGPIVRETFEADPDFLIGECDLSKAESWDTAFITGSPKMIEAVSSPQDFHAVNASMFFGIEYEKIFDDIIKKTLDKKLRDLSKRTNHGATYNMGPQILIDTMGEDKIAEARTLLKLPKFWSLLQIAEYLLAAFHKAYPDIAQRYYPWVVSEVTFRHMLSSRVWHDTEYNRKVNPDSHKYIEGGDWTRYCFGRPDKNKRELNSYIAHCPQSLNARTLNEAYLKVFTEVALPNIGNFKLGPQIHDSTFFQFRKGYIHLAYEVKRCMEIKVHIKSIDGVYREFTVPGDLKLGKDNQGAQFWSDTE